MAQSARRVNRRTERRVESPRMSSGERRNSRYEYVEDGSALREVIVEPAREEQTVSSQVLRNRAKAKNIGAGYVLFLSVVCVACLFLCVNYLQMRTRLIAMNEEIAATESALSSLKAENDAYYNVVSSSVTMDDVKNAALNRLGLHYAAEDQIRYYDTVDNSYVRQYQDVPGA